jgi:superoxide dismutase, Fe-Mn family
MLFLFRLNLNKYFNYSFKWINNLNNDIMSFTLPALKYDYKALEPYIDAQTMEIHHSKHHAAYTNNLNLALENSNLKGKSVEDIIANASGIAPALRNNGGGYYNHNLYWDVMTPGGASAPKGKLLETLNGSFGSFDAFKEVFTKAAMTRFGSGWAWLIQKGDSLVVSSTANQDNPLMDIAEVQGFPVLGIDVWEHAYYLKYQNRRPEYIEAFFKVINWDEVAKRYKG